MLRRTIPILLWALVFALCLGAAQTIQAEVLKLTVEDALALAGEHNLDFQLARLERQAAEGDLRRAQIVGDPDLLFQAQEAWEKAEQLFLEQKQNLQSLVRNSYQELLQKNTAAANINKAKERAENQLAVDEKKYEAGLLSSLDIKRAENSLFDASYRYEMALVELETQKQKFNELLGLPLEQEVVLTERLLLDYAPFTLDLGACYELALEYDAGVLAAAEALKKAQEAVQLAQSPFTPRVELEKALLEQKKAEIRQQQARQTLYFVIRAEYYALQNQSHNLQVMERNIELERQTLQAEESKYAAGVLSNAQIVAQQEKLAQLEQEYSTALLDYSLARVQLLKTLGLEEGRGEGNGD